MHGRHALIFDKIIADDRFEMCDQILYQRSSLRCIRRKQVELEGLARSLPGLGHRGNYSGIFPKHSDPSKSESTVNHGDTASLIEEFLYFTNANDGCVDTA